MPPKEELQGGGLEVSGDRRESRRATLGREEAEREVRRQASEELGVDEEEVAVVEQDGRLVAELSEQGQQQYEQRQREELKERYAEQTGLDESEIWVYEEDGKLVASEAWDPSDFRLFNRAGRRSFRRVQAKVNTAQQLGVDPEEVEASYDGDEIQIELSGEAREQVSEQAATEFTRQTGIPVGGDDIRLEKTEAGGYRPELTESGQESVEQYQEAVGSAMREARELTMQQDRGPASLPTFGSSLAAARELTTQQEADVADPAVGEAVDAARELTTQDIEAVQRTAQAQARQSAAEQLTEALEMPGFERGEEVTVEETNPRARLRRTENVLQDAVAAGAAVLPGDQSGVARQVQSALDVDESRVPTTGYRAMLTPTGRERYLETQFALDPSERTADLGGRAAIEDLDRLEFDEEGNLEAIYEAPAARGITFDPLGDPGGTFHPKNVAKGTLAGLDHTADVSEDVAGGVQEHLVMPAAEVYGEYADLVTTAGSASLDLAQGKPVDLSSFSPPGQDEQEGAVESIATKAAGGAGSLATVPIRTPSISWQLGRGFGTVGVATFNDMDRGLAAAESGLKYTATKAAEQAITNPFRTAGALAGGYGAIKLGAKVGAASRFSSSSGAKTAATLIDPTEAAALYAGKGVLQRTGLGARVLHATPGLSADKGVPTPGVIGGAVGKRLYTATRGRLATRGMDFEGEVPIEAIERPDVRSGQAGGLTRLSTKAAPSGELAIPPENLPVEAADTPLQEIKNLAREFDHPEIRQALDADASEDVFYRAVGGIKGETYVPRSRRPYDPDATFLAPSVARNFLDVDGGGVESGEVRPPSLTDASKGLVDAARRRGVPNIVAVAGETRAFPKDVSSLSERTNFLRDRANTGEFFAPSSAGQQTITGESEVMISAEGAESTEPMTFRGTYYDPEKMPGTGVVPAEETTTLIKVGNPRYTTIEGERVPIQMFRQDTGDVTPLSEQPGRFKRFLRDESAELFPGDRRGISNEGITSTDRGPRTPSYSPGGAEGTPIAPSLSITDTRSGSSKAGSRDADTTQSYSIQDTPTFETGDKTQATPSGEQSVPDVTNAAEDFGRALSARSGVSERSAAATGQTPTTPSTPTVSTGTVSVPSPPTSPISTPQEPSAPRQPRSPLSRPQASSGSKSTTRIDEDEPSVGPSNERQRDDFDSELGEFPNILSPGYYNEYVTALAGRGLTPREAPSQDALEAQPTAARATETLPTAAQLSGSDATQERIDEATEFLGGEGVGVEGFEGGDDLLAMPDGDDGESFVDGGGLL